jgi:hypothetical protein
MFTPNFIHVLKMFTWTPVMHITNSCFLFALSETVVDPVDVTANKGHDENIAPAPTDGIPAFATPPPR